MIGVILSKFKKLDILDKFVYDLFFNGQIEQISLDPNDFIDIISNIDKYKLDFDDSYQLTIAQKYDLTIVSFDKQNVYHSGFLILNFGVQPKSSG